MGKLASLQRRGRSAAVILPRSLEGSSGFNGLRGRLDVGITRRVGQAEGGGKLGHARDDAFVGRLYAGLFRRRCDEELSPCCDRDGQEHEPGRSENRAEDAHRRYTRCKGCDD